MIDDGKYLWKPAAVMWIEARVNVYTPDVSYKFGREQLFTVQAQHQVVLLNDGTNGIFHAQGNDPGLVLVFIRHQMVHRAVGEIER